MIISTLNSTNISWTTSTWNPVTGCTQCSKGCKNCYAKEIAERFQSQGKYGYENGFDVTLHGERLRRPCHDEKPKLIFVCSMSDLFHKDVPSWYIDRVMDVIRSANIHTYQILTKRTERMAEYFSTRAVPDNVWLGTTVESAEYKGRIDILRGIDAKTRFLSCEPLVGDLGELNLNGIDCVIVGGERTDSDFSRARQMKKEWVLNIKRQCNEQGTIFHFKQWGTVGEDGVRRPRELNGHMLDGKIYRGLPKLHEAQPALF